MADDFCSYEEVSEWFKRARDATKGRPVLSWGRVYMEGDDFVFHAFRTEFGRLSSDNVFTFTASIPRIKTISHTLTSSLHNMLCINFTRQSLNKYRVVHRKNTIFRNRLPAEDWPEYFEGIKFNILTGECVNYRPDLKDLVKQDADKVWKSKLRTFRRGIKLRMKLGIIESIFNKTKSTIQWQKRSFYAPVWSSDEWLHKLYLAIHDEVITKELLEGFVRTAYCNRYYLGTSGMLYNPDWIAKVIEKILNESKTELRIRFNVFEGVSK